MNCKKIAASILAFTLITGAATTNAGFISNVIPTNTIVAEAAISSGDWQFEPIDNFTARITGYTGQGGYVIIPESIKDPNTNKSYTVKEFGTSVFYNNKKITSVAVPRGIAEIPNNMFCKASNLTDVFLPHGIKKIGSYAFGDTTKLTSISLPTTLEEIDTHAFIRSGVTSVTLPSSLKNIRAYAFNGSKLTSVTLPNTLQSVANDAFSECPDLQSVTINCNCSLGRYIFADSNKLTNVNISNNCMNKVLSSGALGNCKNLKKINNIQVLRKTSDGKPYFDSRYSSYITTNFAICDECGVSFINDYLDAMIKYVVKTETAGCTSGSQKVKKLHDWVCDKVHYAFGDEKNKEVHCDSSVFFRDTTVCDGHARALTLLLQEAGFEAYYLSSNIHAWTMVRIGDLYFHLDACHDDTPRDYDHFLKSDTDIKKCNQGHSKWTIKTPTNRYKNPVPATIPVCRYSVGDVNMDGKINQSDVDLLTKYLARTAQIKNTTLADVNCDGSVDISDAIAIYDLF